MHSLLSLCRSAGTVRVARKFAAGGSAGVLRAVAAVADEPAEAMPKLKGHELIDNFIEKSETDQSYT